MTRKDSPIRWLLHHWADLATVLAMLAAMSVAACMMTGCAGAKITPAVNKVDAVQTSSGPAKRTTITIGGVPVKEAK